MLENHVTSLELSKRLKELGVKQESLFYWHDMRYDQKIDNRQQPHGRGWEIFSKERLPHSKEKVSAFLASELGELLPATLESKKDENYDYGLRITKRNDEYFIVYEYNNWLLNIEKDKNLTNALAKMLIYLLENSLLTI